MNEKLDYVKKSDYIKYDGMDFAKIMRQYIASCKSKQQAVYTRMATAYILKLRKPYSTAHIARLLGIEHATINYYFEVINNELNVNKELTKIINYVNKKYILSRYMTLQEVISILEKYCELNKIDIIDFYSLDKYMMHRTIFVNLFTEFLNIKQLEIAYIFNITKVALKSMSVYYQEMEDENKDFENLKNDIVLFLLDAMDNL